MKRPIIISSVAIALLVACLAYAFAQSAVQPLPGDAAAPFEPQASPIAMSQNVTASTCTSAWHDAPAKAFCYYTDIDVTSNNRCHVEVTCEYGQDTELDTSYTGTVNNVKRLRWCHPSNQYYGFLKVGSC